MAKDINEEVIHTLADMNEAIGNRFDQVGEQIGEVRGDLNRLENSVRNQFTEVNGQLTEVRSQLDRIEHIILEDHARRIDALERQISATH